MLGLIVLIIDRCLVFLSPMRLCRIVYCSFIALDLCPLPLLLFAISKACCAKVIRYLQSWYFLLSTNPTL